MASRMEVDLSRLLLQCEKMAAAEECDDNWRYEQVSRPPLVDRALRGFCRCVAHVCHVELCVCRLHWIIKAAQNTFDIPFDCFLSL